MRLELVAESWQTVRFQNRREQFVPDGWISWAKSTAAVYSSSARNLRRGRIDELSGLHVRKNTFDFNAGQSFSTKWGLLFQGVDLYKELLIYEYKNNENYGGDHSFLQNVEFWAKLRNFYRDVFEEFCVIRYWLVIGGQIWHILVGFRWL